MNRVIIYLLLYFAVNIQADDRSGITAREKLEYIRVNYYASVEDEDIADKLENYINRYYPQDHKTTPVIITAYRAALLSVRSKHATWPVNKLNYYNKSMDLFEKVILRDPFNLEVRFLRFSILHYVPFFLADGDDRSEDARIIVEQLLKRDYSSIKPDIQIGIIDFMIKSERLTEEQAKQLIKLRNEILNE